MDIQHHVRPMLDQAAAALHFLAAANEAARAAATLDLNDELAQVSATAAMADALQSLLANSPHVKAACWLLGGLSAATVARAVSHSAVIVSESETLLVGQVRGARVHGELVRAAALDEPTAPPCSPSLRRCAASVRWRSICGHVLLKIGSMP